MQRFRHLGTMYDEYDNQFGNIFAKQIVCPEL